MQAAAARGVGRALPLIGGAAAAATAVSAPVAHADAVAPQDVLPRRIADDWELADVRGKDVVLFSAADIDSAVALLTRAPPSAVIEELPADDDPGSDGSAGSSSSDGSADAVIARSSGLYAPAALRDGDGGVIWGLDSDMFAVAARLLKAPGVQREICSAALSDPEVFGILASKMDLPAYLEGQGFAARGLLGAGQAGAAGSDAYDGSDGGDGAAAWEAASAWAADRLEELGLAVARLGRWIRRQLLGGGGGQGAGAGAGADGRADSSRAGAGGGALAAVVVACVAIVTVVLLKKPAYLRRVAAAMRAGE